VSRPLFEGSRFLLVAGPCVLEDHGLNARIARHVEAVSAALGVSAVFKASFDKANRTSAASPRGPGLAAGAEELARIKGEVGLPVLTDVHESQQVARIVGSVDALQIPAFLCRQTDLLTAAGESGLPVNIKKGQWMAPEEMAGAVEKARAGGASEVTVTERGTIHGYGDLVVDMRSFRRVRESCGVPVIFDGTHSVQRPGRAEGSSGGDPRHIPTLVRAAVAAGCDGLFLEVHPRPGEAPSDSTNMLPLDRLPALLRDVRAVREALSGAEVVEEVR
jgi:2-dehydro-3-deoxyphosphooctonate aldolase (KDO 8-P synthase)